MSYTIIDDPSAFFQVATYTGNSSTQTITNDGNSDLQPDFVWIKARSSSTYNHALQDTSRGLNLVLGSNTNNADGDVGNNVTSVNSDGFALGDWSHANYNSVTYVAWQWKCAAGSTSSNTSGDISSTVQANTTAGFSIVTYTGNGSQDQTIGHGLGAVPKMIFYKNRTNNAYWYVYNVDTGNDTMMYLNLDNAAQSLSSQFSTPTTTTFNVSNENSTFNGYNTNGDNYVAYVFAEVQGYSKIGQYSGNYQTSAPYNGPFVYCGFEPAFVMIKRSDSANDWIIFDHKRDEDQNGNVVNPYIEANTSIAETNYFYTGVDMLSNGFKVRGYDGNANAYGTYIFMAFAKHPFVSSSKIPNTAR